MSEPFCVDATELRVQTVIYLLSCFVTGMSRISIWLRLLAPMDEITVVLDSVWFRAVALTGNAFSGVG